MNLRDNPKVVAVAERIQQEQGFDPLDIRRAEAAARRYVGMKHSQVPGARKTSWWMAGSLLLLALTVMERQRPPAAAFFGVLFLFSLIPAIRAQRAYAREVHKIKRETLPYMRAFIECIRATSDDPKMQKRIEKQWLAERGLHKPLPSR